jgi:hypothetical protein
MATSIEELAAKVAELEARLAEQGPAVRIFARVLAEMQREGAKPPAQAEQPAAEPDLEAASARADEMLRRIRLRRQKGG